MSEENRLPLELRAADVGEVNFPNRTIEVIAVPYEETAIVRYRGEMWAESFARSAFDGIENRAGKVRVNREHRKGATVGKITRFAPENETGLLAEVRIAKTLAGDETLALAEDGMVSASVGFGVRGSDQELDRSATPPHRLVRKAFLDHLAFVEDPAYEGATVQDVRGDPDDDALIAANMKRLVTPGVDEWAAYLRHRRRLNAAS